MRTIQRSTELTFDTLEQCELAQALACVPLIERVGSAMLEAGELLYKAGSYLLERGRFEEAKPVLERAVALGEQLHGLDHPALIPLLEKQDMVSFSGLCRA